MVKGIGASKGIGIGTVIVLKEQSLVFHRQTSNNIETELNRFEEAMQKFVDSTMKMVEDVRIRVGENEARILEGQVMMISDPMFGDEIRMKIKDGESSEAGVADVCDQFITMFSSFEDELMRQRASDIQDIKTRFLKQLLNADEVDISKVEKGTILVANDLTPSMTAEIVKENVAGIITETGGKTSHSAILARALEIPAVLSVTDVTERLRNGQKVVVDGTNGKVIEHPTEEQLEEYRLLQSEYEGEKKDLDSYKNKKTVTGDGEEKELFVNIGSHKDIDKVLENDGEGIGLFRTEFLFMDKETMPDEEEQFEAYYQAVTAMNGKTVIIRTLDVGGDKEIPYLGLEKEENPFLGYRAIRFCLDREELYRIQLRALLRASAFGNLKIMIPMVTCAEEVRRVKAVLQELMQELKNQRIACNEHIQVGVMIETPAAVMIADILAKEADFFSIGTNDLTQYTMAVDRGNAKVAYLYSTYQPAVLRAILRVIECAKKEKIMVGMCGESAADPLLIPLYTAFGLDEFSVSATSVLATRKAISKVKKEKVNELFEQIMALSTEAEIMEALRQYQRSL